MKKALFIFIIIFLHTALSKKNQAENFHNAFALSFLKKNKQALTNDQKSNFYPQWITNKNKIIPIADTLIGIIRSSRQDGLDPREYHLREIENLLRHSLNSENKKKLSALLTDAFMLLTAHHYAGRICSEKEGNIDWYKHVSEINPCDSLKNVFQNGGMKKMVFSFSCKHQQYLALQKGLSEYLLIQKEGGWARIPITMSIKKGEKNNRILSLRKRLAVSHDLIQPGTVNDSTFDSILEESIKGFQYRHALTANGKIDKALIRELNIPVEKRIRQISLNMDRWRWLPRKLPDTLIMVNIARFKLTFIQNNHEILDMKIIAGTTFHPTPLFHSVMSYINLNPGWDIPMSIARNEILPHLKRDKNYVSQNNIKIFESRKPDAAIIHADSVLWDTVSAENFHFRLRQMPGADNPLGSMKFMFPNISYVYFHDTPNRELFSNSSRAFSHGCMRIEKPFELAALLLKKDTLWIKNKLNDAVTKKKEIKLMIPSQEEVFICYWTTYADQSGKICFEKDMYQYDIRMEEFMNSRKCIPYFTDGISVKPAK